MKSNNNSGAIAVFIYASLLICCLTLSVGCGSTATQKTGAVTGPSVSEPAINVSKSDTNTAALLDDDSDGVVNADDQCKETEPNTWVDIKGCALDTDGDTIADSRDACRGTPRGVKVDARGCGFDDDHDGVPNFRDRCSNTIADVSVDGNGCEWDSDNDGIVDSKDLCTGTPPGVTVEPMGCHIIEVVTLKGVHFQTGSDLLNSNAKRILNNVARTLREHPRMRVEVAGHTDNTGSADINNQLSLDRARRATRFLTDLGINKKILITRGYADRQPVATNATAEGRLQNRRVELRFIEID